MRAFSGLLILLFLCAARTAVFAEPWDAPPIERSIAIRDGRTDADVSQGEFISQLGQADAVFLGEQHTDETTHRLQLEILDCLITNRDSRVVLSLEMFDRDVQPELNRYLAGEIDEETFLAKACPWGNYHEAYRPLVERAKQAGIPVIAANFPAPVRQRLMMAGPEAWESLSAEDRAVTPREYLANSPEYWKRMDNAIRGHAGMMSTAETAEERLHSTQSLWDNSMGEACADALKQHPGHAVLHVNGGFHSAYWQGVVDQFRQRNPDAKVKTVAIVPTSNPISHRNAGTPSADYEALVEARASNIDQGKRSVAIGGSLSYLLHMPKDASPEKRVPLLIWLSDDGLTAEEGMELCRQRFGDAAAIAVIEAPTQERQFDLAIGGRWFLPATFTEDIGGLFGGVEETWAYLLRHFPIDPQHVALAGEGSGATVVAAVILQTDRLSASAVAINPRHYAKLKDIPLPLPEYRLESARPKRSLVVTGPADSEKWWQEELAAYTEVGVPSRFVVAATDPWQREAEQDGLLAAALGKPTADVSEKLAGKVLVVPEPSARAQHWGRLQSRWLSEQLGTPVAVASVAPSAAEGETISIAITPPAAARPGALPKCPGPFGGTTVIVLPAGVSTEEIAAWKKLEADDPLTKASRFHRTRIATHDGELALPSVLKKLEGENRRNVLIVPAMFYAPTPWLHELAASAAEFENRMTLQWQPGLGGRKEILEATQKK
ncbi:ChaN family lipoprotein [Lacipirellula sp.]|uniref:ChaN family lipoprotein n=1 Tax=Lacipirellula sp. TaxID=2691419 RepID=UPI003D0FCFAA